MTRVSDSMKYRMYLQNIARVNGQMQAIETQVATGKTVNTPSDDPVKYATNVDYDAALSIISRLTSNLESLVVLSGIYDTCFTTISDQLDIVTDLANNADTMDEGLLAAASQNIEDIIESLVDVANTTCGNSYIFGGQQADSAPFQLNNDYSVTFNVYERAEDATSIYLSTTRTGQYGVSGRQAFYSTSKIACGSVDNAYTGEIYANTDSFCYVMDGTNNTVSLTDAAGSTTITIASGMYTGSTLAKEIASVLGPNYSVAFDSTTRKFIITNNSGGDTTFDWSASSAADTLGFDKSPVVLKDGDTQKSDRDTGRTSFYVRISTSGSTTGSTGRATYQYSTDGVTWSSDITVSTSGADASAGDIVIDATNDTLYVNGSPVTLNHGTYTGAALASELTTQLGTGCSVSYDNSTRKFSIINDTGSILTLNWSDPGSTAAGVLGFETADSVLSNGATDTGDYDAGMFIDGSGVANTTNRGLKLSFSTDDKGLTTQDTFRIEDLSVFDLLKNFRNAFDAGNTEWIAQNLQYLEDAEALITSSSTVTAYQGVHAETLMTVNDSKTAAIEDVQSELVDADTATLGVKLSALTTTYETLMAAMSKALSLNIVDYL
jgi:flagellin-like hook-associated protein FlgL